MNEPAPSDAETCDVLLVGGLVLTLDARDTVWPDGAVAIQGRSIAEIGSRERIISRWSAPRVLDCRRRILIPGLINIHNHTPLMITRGMIEDLGFAPMFTPGVPQGHHLDEEDTLVLARLGTYELLRQGCTTVVDFYRHPQALAQAHAELGTRAVVAGRVHDADLEALTQKRYMYSPAIGRATLDENAQLIERWDGYDNGRIRCQWAPHAPDTCSPELLRELAQVAEQSTGNIHTHLCQSRVEVAQVEDLCGKTPPQLLDSVGLLNERLIAAHCIHVTSADIALIGAARITMAYTPIGNAKTGRIAPALQLAEAGASVTLCTDTFSGDLFEAMRWGLSMQRVRTEGAVLSARTALRWACENGARALGLWGQVGSLEPGKKADIVVIDATAPTAAPVVDGYGILVYSVSGPNVHTVLVDGQIVVENGQLVTGDGPAIVRDAQGVAERLWRRVGRESIIRVSE